MRIGKKFAFALPTIGLALVALATQTATAQQPALSDRPIRMLYGFAAGGSGDGGADCQGGGRVGRGVRR